MGLSLDPIQTTAQNSKTSENGLYKKGTEVDVFSPPKIEGEGRKANSDVVHADVDGSETLEKGSEPDETELVDEVIDGNEVGDDDGEEDEDSSVGGEDKVGDDPSRDEVPVIIDSRSDEEGQNAIGKYGRCTKDTRKIRGVEKVAPMSHALKVFDGKHKPSSLVVDQERKWADVVAGAQSKGPAANQTQESISK
ncbi:hypothetical protein U1Q18_040776, partial [Sarracenia purpurea var. burkii]